TRVTATVSEYLQAVVAGSGGDSTNGAGGVGGSVTFVKTNRDIGNFAAPFGGDSAGSAFDQSGGIFAGVGGLGTGAVRAAAGNVTDIKAARIASILAAGFRQAPNQLTNANAANSIARITATAIGSDLGAVGFDFTNAGAAGFHLGDGDTALDGLVIVKAGGFDSATIPAIPLLKIEV
ncbi:MAG: hypothetical protein WCF18_05545, partial [Chthoniobacteraceae bacterium]